MYKEKLEDFVLAFKNLYLLEKYKNLGFNCFWNFQITSFYELRNVIKYEPCYLLLGAPLFFSLKKVKNITEIPLCLIANLAVEPYLNSKNGICGNYVRPEDVKNYEEYIDFLCFYGNETQEEVLFNTYKAGSWPGNLNLLIQNLNFNIDNRLIPQDFSEKRMNCGQRCMENGICHYCESTFKLADTIRKVHKTITDKGLN